MDLKEMRWERVDQIYLVQDRDKGCCEHGDEASGSIKHREFIDFCGNVSFSRMTLSVELFGWLIDRLGRIFSCLHEVVCTLIISAL